MTETTKQGAGVGFNLFELRQRLELAHGRRYSWDEIAEKSGLHPHTLYNLSGNKSKRVDMTTLGALLRFFRGEGMPITFNDLFTELDEEGGAVDAK